MTDTIVSSNAKGKRLMSAKLLDNVTKPTTGLMCALVAFAAAVNSPANATGLRPPEQTKRKESIRPLRVSKPTRGENVRAIGAAKRKGQVTTEAYPPGKPRPKIECAVDVHDFGTVWVGPVLQHTFQIRNTGEAPLDIKKVKPSCGCTIAGTYPKRLDPGEAGEFPFSVSSTKLRGKFEKSITVTTNDPANPSLRLRLRGEVKRYVEMVPAAVHFGKLFGAEKQERVVKITNNTENPLRLKVAKPLDGNFSVKINEKVPGQVFELIVTANPPFKPGAFRKTLTLSTNVEAQTTVNVPVRGSVPQRLDVSPAVLNIGRLDADNNVGRKLTRIVRFTNYGATPTKVLGVTTTDPSIIAKVKEQTAGKSYSVEIQIPKGLKMPTTGKGPVITLLTDDAEKPRIDVPIRATPSRSSRKVTRKRPAEELVGKKAPTFVLTTTTGKTVTNKDSGGNIVVLDFFAPNCGFCKKQIPRLEKIRAAFEGKPVRFVAVSQTMRGKQFTNEQVKGVLAQTGFTGELAINSENTVGKLFKATSYPTMVVLGKSGKVEAVNVGNMSDLESRLTQQLNALIAGKAIPKIKTVAKKSTTKTPARKRADSLIGKPAPKFSINTFEGKTVSNSGFAKHPATILNFIAGNCGYCKKQLPRLEKLRQQYASKGVRFVNVVQTMRKEYSKEEITEILNKTGSKLEIAQDKSNEIGRKFYASSYPTMVIVGKSGKVEAVTSGNAADLESRVKQQLDALIAGKKVPTIAAAKRPTRKRADSLIGKPAPAFTIDTFDGKKINSSDFSKNAATVLNFVAGNCGYCKKQVPRVEKIRQAYESKGVKFYNIVQTMRKDFTQKQLTDIFVKAGSKLTLAQDKKNAIGAKYYATGFPTMVIVGKSGKVEAVNSGNISDLESRMKQQLDAIIAGKPIPKIVRAEPSNRKRPNSLIGKAAPAFSIKTFEGKLVSNAELAKSSATVLNFVAGNCGFCKKQLPRVEKIRQQYAAKGVRFVNIAQTMRKEFSQAELTDILNKTGSKLEIAQDLKNEVGKKFSATGYPTMVILGKSGKVEAINVGNVSDLESRMKQQLDAIIAGRPVPSIAKAAPTPKPQRKRPGSLIGKPAPAFTINTFEGKPVSNAEFAKHPATVLNFVAGNCGYCKKQLPRVEKLRPEYVSKGVRFVNVVQSMRKEYTKDEILGILDKAGSKLEVAHDTKNVIGKKFYATGYPTMVIVGRSGNVEAVNVGNVGDLEKRMKGALDALIAGKKVPTVAAAAKPTRRRPALDMVGKPAPKFTLTTLDGKPVSNAEFSKSKATVLNFVAPNCGYCKRSLPKVEKVRKEYEAKGVRFVNVMQKMRKDFTNDQIMEVLNKTGSKLEVTMTDFAANNAVGRQFKATSFPTMFVVDKNGKVTNVNVGAKANLDTLLKGQLDALLKG